MVRLARVARARALAHSALGAACLLFHHSLMLVSAEGFDPPTSCMSRRRSGRLSYAERWHRWRDSNPRPLDPKSSALMH